MFVKFLRIMVLKLQGLFQVLIDDFMVPSVWISHSSIQDTQKHSKYCLLRVRPNIRILPSKELQITGYSAIVCKGIFFVFKNKLTHWSTKNVAIIFTNKVCNRRLFKWIYFVTQRTGRNSDICLRYTRVPIQLFFIHRIIV